MFWPNGQAQKKAGFHNEDRLFRFPHSLLARQTDGTRS
jgi:hypothetical protein